MKKGFNLLKSQGEPPSVWTKIYDWVVGTARIIIIVVELIVLVAFGIRVVIDIQSKELDKQIAQNEAILNVLKDSETQFRNIQAKTASYKMIWNASPDYANIVTNINSILPINSSIKDITVSIDSGNVSISGVAPKAKETEVRDLENNLKSNAPYLKDVLLEKLEDTPIQLKFLFRAKLVNVETKDLSTVQ